MHCATLALITLISSYSDNASLDIVFVGVKVVCVFDAVMSGMPTHKEVVNR